MSEIKVLLLKPCLRTDEAAILLDVTPRTIRRYVEEGKLETKPALGRQIRIVTDSVKRYI